jgi:hypothetical protein
MKMGIGFGRLCMITGSGSSVRARAKRECLNDAETKDFTKMLNDYLDNC